VKVLADFVLPLERYTVDKVQEKRSFSDFGSSLLATKTHPSGLIFVWGLHQ
jgi:hypothetical protein